jgi:hypothetical protein
MTTFRAHESPGDGAAHAQRVRLRRPYAESPVTLLAVTRNFLMAAVTRNRRHAGISGRERRQPLCHGCVEADSSSSTLAHDYTVVGVIYGSWSQRNELPSYFRFVHAPFLEGLTK